MSLSGAVEIVVGLVFAYFVFSSICSGVNEGIARVLNLRGTALFRSINALIGNVDQALAFWEHPLISGLAKTRSKAGALEAARVSRANGITTREDGSIVSSATRATRKVLPSYISPSVAITAMLAVAGVPPPSSLIPNSTPLPLAGEEGDGPAGQGAPPASTTSGFASVLSTISGTAQGDDQRIVADLEKWFDDTMDRLTGWYKRYVQLMLLALAVLVTVAFNVNTIHIAQELWREPVLQSVINQEASQPQKSIGYVSSSTRGQATTPEPLSTSLQQAEALPIGWGTENRPTGATEWELTVLGWLITIGALALGAPFWFDLLSRMNSLRATGPPPKT